MKNPLIQIKQNSLICQVRTQMIILVLPSTKENSDSLMKTVEFLDIVDDLSQKPSSVIEEKKPCHTEHYSFYTG